MQQRTVFVTFDMLLCTGMEHSDKVAAVTKALKDEQIDCDLRPSRMNALVQDFIVFSPVDIDALEAYLTEIWADDVVTLRRTIPGKSVEMLIPKLKK